MRLESVSCKIENQHMGRYDSSEGQLEFRLGETATRRASSAPGSYDPWVVRQYSKTRVDKAGRALVEGTESDADLEVINNWRSSHSFPLNTFQMTLRRKASHVDVDADVAQRLKRLSSIRQKLGKTTMKLSQMQDIGGCRAVVSSAARVRALRDRYLSSEIRHDFVDEDDYIQEPRKSGYRSVHLIYRYLSDKKAKESYNGLQIEIQLRSRLQHAWATAVETVDTFTEQALKSSEGDERWLRFFALMGSALAIRERTPTVEGTPASDEDLRAELRAVADELNVLGKLASYHVALEMTDEASGSKTNYFLVELQPSVNRVSVTKFAKREVERATEEYLKSEKALAGESGSQAVLVSVESIEALKRAYPNYFLDTRRFIEAVKLAIR